MNRLPHKHLIFAGIGLVSIILTLSVGTHWLSEQASPDGFDAAPEVTKRTFVPDRVEGDARVEAEVTSAQGLEMTINSEAGGAIVFFDPDSFAEQAELTIAAEIQPVSTLFGTAKEGLNLPDETIELSPTLSIRSLAGNSGALQRVRVSLPFSDATTAEERLNYNIIAIFSHPLVEGGITTTSLSKKAIDYRPEGLVTYWTQGIPLETVVVGIPK